MRNLLFECKCKSCSNLIKKTDDKGWVRYSCPFVKGVEHLGAVNDVEFDENCGQYKMKNQWELPNDR